MTYANYMGQNPNLWLNNQPYQNPISQQYLLNGNFVSNIAEAIATKPDITGKPLFFYNKAEEEIYIKQYDNTGNAPVKTYKLVVENVQPEINPLVEGFKNLDTKLDDIKKLLTPQIIEETEKRNKKQ